MESELDLEQYDFDSICTARLAWGASHEHKCTPRLLLSAIIHQLSTKRWVHQRLWMWIQTRTTTSWRDCAKLYATHQKVNDTHILQILARLLTRMNEFIEWIYLDKNTKQPKGWSGSWNMENICVLMAQQIKPVMWFLENRWNPNVDRRLTKKDILPLRTRGSRKLGYCFIPRLDRSWNQAMNLPWCDFYFDILYKTRPMILCESRGNIFRLLQWGYCKLQLTIWENGKYDFFL